jgi:hypothetical protein
MSRSKPRPPAENRDTRKSRTATIDDEIAALLATIEKETMPGRLQDLAVKLQDALRKRTEESAGAAMRSA